MLEFLKRLFGGTEPPATPEPGISLPVEYVRVHGRDALRERDALRSRPGITPVILGAPEDMALIQDILADPGPSAAEVIEEARSIDVEKWLQEQAASEDAESQPPPAEWPSGSASASIDLTVPKDALTRRPKKVVLIGLFPTANSWEAPAYLRYGGWNECPEPAVQVAFHKRWHERYGSVIACMSGDVIECIVERPPRTREAAMALAREQFLYCPDIVHQGVESMEALAALLLDGKTWYFWWD